MPAPARSGGDTYPPSETGTTVSHTATVDVRVGDTVHYHLNDDLCVSPAVVLNTRATTRADVLAAQRPRDPATGEPIAIPSSDTHVDLLVHGLVRSYRVYDVPHSAVAAGGHWTPLPARG